MPGVDLYGLKLYAIAQASLVVSLMLCGALALLSSKPRLVFAILSVNVLLHLLLDATQTKWGSGVHLFAPISWQEWNAGLYWPESPISLVLAIGGLIAWGWAWTRGDMTNGGSGQLNAKARLLPASAALVVLYFVVPFGLRAGPLAADSHSVRTFLERDSRVGRFVQFDRERYKRGVKGDTIFSFAAEGFAVRGERASNSSRVSAQATFVARDTVLIRSLQEHAPGLRDVASYLGLLLLLLLWMRELWPRGKAPA